MDPDYTHPELYNKDLIFMPEGKITEEIRAQRKGAIVQGWAPIDVELCRSCGWKSGHEILSSYTSRIRIFKTRDNIGLWAIGSKWLIRDQPNDQMLGNDLMTQQFLRSQPNLTIPLIREMRLLSEPEDKIHFTLMSRAQGVTLMSIWRTLSQAQKANYSSQFAGYLTQLRRFTADTAQKVDGSVPDDVILTTCGRRHPPTCRKVGRTREEWLDGFTEYLRHGLAVLHRIKNLTRGTDDWNMLEEKIREMKEHFPSCEPYVLTHADLNLHNIIVKDDKIEAIIDWEMSAYLPWWAERWLCIMFGDDDYDEFFSAVWDKMYPEMSEEAFRAQVCEKIAPVREALSCCPTEHPNSQAVWFRPPFCACKPFAGFIKLVCLGHNVEHRIKGVDLSTHSDSHAVPVEVQDETSVKDISKLELA